MKKSFTYRLLLLVILLLTSNALVAQIFIPDPNFRKHLMTDYAVAMNPDSTLNPVGAASVNYQFFCINKNVTNLQGIQYFVNATTLEVKKNLNLTSIPNIDALTDITILGLDSNGLTSLPNVSTLTNLEIFSVKYNKLTTLPSLSGLTKIELILVDGNQLTVLPSLSSQVNLIKLFCNDNPLLSLPSFAPLTKLTHFLCQRTQITAFPNFSTCTLLEILVCTDNNATVFPDLSTCPLLKEIKVFKCKFTTLPDISGFGNLTSFKAERNFFTFEDLIPLMDDPFYSNYLITPQYHGAAQSFGAFATAPFTIDVNIDDAVSTNRYSWFKNGDSITTTTENKFTFASIQFSDAGVYTCKVRNISPALAGVEIHTAPITITVVPCIVANTVSFSTPTSACEYPINVSIDENSFTGGAKPFTYEIRQLSDSVLFSTNNISLQREGTYDIVVHDTQGCRVVFASTLVVSRPSDCDPVFYPNGDGVADTYYIEDAGSVKIYNRAGEVIKQLAAPAYWDGTNQSGKNLPSGLYVIEINNSKTQRVTLLR